MISGHQSGQRQLPSHRCRRGLNPFDIRASVRTLLQWPTLPRPRRLNPFDIRASVRTQMGVWVSLTSCLNPFDIRASVRTPTQQKLSPWPIVSIPLISGHQSGRHAWEHRRVGWVSIPLISGHQSGPTITITQYPSMVSIPLISGHQSGPKRSVGGSFSICLNPFDIRASVRTPCGRYPVSRRCVSIPLISGHQSGHRRPPCLGCDQSQSL